MEICPMDEKSLVKSTEWQDESRKGAIMEMSRPNSVLEISQWYSITDSAYSWGPVHGMGGEKQNKKPQRLEQQNPPRAHPRAPQHIMHLWKQHQYHSLAGRSQLGQWDSNSIAPLWPGRIDAASKGEKALLGPGWDLECGQGAWERRGMLSSHLQKQWTWPSLVEGE